MSGRTAIQAILVTFAAASAASAAPPAAGPPPAVDIIYMHVPSNSWGEPAAATIRGLGVTAEGTPSADAALGKGSDVFSNSVTWDPGGAWAAWAQAVDRKGTRGIVAAQLGGGVRTVLTFPSGNVQRRNGRDTIAWGKGCNGRSVIVFSGYDGRHGLFMFDPFEANARAQLLHVVGHGPDGSPDLGHGLAFSPEGQHLAFVEQDEAGRNNVVALPLTCLPGVALPVAAGAAQRLFEVLAQDGLDGGRGMTLALDWSPDGRRLAATVSPLLVWNPGSRTWGVQHIAVGELAYGTAGGIEQVSAAGNLSQATFAWLGAHADVPDDAPAWGRAGEFAACDPLAFNRNGALMVVNVPRTGYGIEDCAVRAPVRLTSTLVAGFDWK